MLFLTQETVFINLINILLRIKPVSLFISHFHIDHVSGLHSLAKFAFPRGIDVYVGSGRTKEIFENTTCAEDDLVVSI